MAFDATVGGPSANSYATEAFSIEYFAETGRSNQWQKAIDAAGGAEPALRNAMLYIEGQSFLGGRSNADPENPQALDFPRRVPQAGLYGSTSGETWLDNTGRSWTFDAIPTPIKEAQCEQALVLQLSPQYTDENLKSKVMQTQEGKIEWNLGAGVVGSLCNRAALLFAAFLAGGSAGAMNGRSHR